MSEPETSERPPAEVRIGSYLIVEPLGTGGMSSVYRAKHAESGHEVAIKVLPRSLAKNSSILQRFLREAKNAESLEHPNIVTIFDRGADQGRYYLVLEYVPGGDLHDQVRRDGPLSITDALAVAKGVAWALKFAASRGVIHRDVKPANILLGPDGVVKVIDLGLALQAQADDERVTRDGTTVGTVDYMAPEQARDSRAATIQSDIYSLGCTLYYLLTGSPPFPGGTVSDKLSRHYRDPAPDPRTTRPEVPETLADVIQVMMAKRPEDRFPNYDALIDALDDARKRNDASTIEAPYLDVVVDDDSESPPLRYPERAPADRFVPPISLFDLAPISSDQIEERPDPSKAKGGRDVSKLLTFDDQNSVQAGVIPDAIPIEDDSTETDVVGGSSPPPLITAPDSSAPTHVYVGFGVVFGLVVAMLGVGIVLLLSKDADKVAASPLNIVEMSPATIEVVSPILQKPATPDVPAKFEAPPWIEPPDPERDILAAASYPVQKLEQALSPLARERPEPPSPSALIVRRVPHPADAASVPDIRMAFDSDKSEIEIADNGPFFESDLKVIGRSRRIRARSGTRPALTFIRPSIANNSMAVFQLRRAKLVLEGIDLYIVVRDLPSAHQAVFDCQGSDLILRDCTVTLVGGDRPIPLIHASDSTDRMIADESRVVLDRTTIRTDVAAPFQFDTARCEFDADGCLILGGPGPLIRVGSRSADNLARRISLVRSVVAGQGPLIDFTPTGDEILQVRTLGSTLARLTGSDSASLLAVPKASSTSAINWIGSDDRLAGWGSLMNAGQVSRVLDLAGARDAWPGMGAETREEPGPWILAPATTRIEQVEILAPERLATLSRTARPQPGLAERTVDSFKPLAIPDLIDSRATAADANSMAAQVAPSPGALNGQATSSPAQLKADGRPDEVFLEFHADASPWDGDLGRFLTAQIPNGAKRVRVRAVGTSVKNTSPILMRNGISLEIEVVPPPPGQQPLSWKPSRSAGGAALISTRRGDLVLRGVQLRREGGGVDHLVRVEAGHLVMTDCLLTSTGIDAYPGDELVEFRALETRPLPPNNGPFVSPWDLPTCLIRDSIIIQGGGVALVAEVARGAISLSNCAISASQDAIRLLPERSSRSRFEADLQLNRCTITAGRSAIWSGRWQGETPGPDRPWLIASKECLFIDPFPGRAMAVLRADPDGISTGSFLWQGERDVLQTYRFIDSTRPKSAAAPPMLNIKRDWIDLWGPRHIRDVIGPTPSSRGTLIRLVVDRPDPALLSPGDLAIDDRYVADSLRGRKVGVDYSHLPATPTKPSSVRSPRRR